MKLETFAMERLQSTWENRVAWNVSESGVHPLRVEEVAETDDERHGERRQRREEGDRRRAPHRALLRRRVRSTRKPAVSADR